MAHHCKILVLHCIDFRLGTHLKKFHEEKKMLGNCDIVSIAGAVKNLTDPHEPTDKEFTLRQIGIAKRLHNIQEVMLINHTDCGAYGGSAQFKKPDDERIFHMLEMKKAKDIIQERFPSLEVVMYLAKMAPFNRVTFEKVTPETQ